jgi:hypothetical protein
MIVRRLDHESDVVGHENKMLRLVTFYVARDHTLSSHEHKRCVVSLLRRSTGLRPLVTLEVTGRRRGRRRRLQAP